MDGIIVVNKEQGFTSRDVVNKLGKILKTKKIGHTGTLDPLATGVLVVCVGKATKLVELLTSKEKEYVAQVTLGINTDTLDITGNIIEKQVTNIDENSINKVLKNFPKSYEQEVPIYSAVKINGKKLYEYARNGEDINIPKRVVEIKKLERISDVKHIDGKTIFMIKTLVSKGTYIRSLIRDIAINLNTIGVMSSLMRTKQGIFDIKNSYSLTDIEKGNFKMLSIEEALDGIKKVVVNEQEAFKIKNGVPISNKYNSDLVLFKNKEKIIALYKNDNGILKSHKYFG